MEREKTDWGFPRGKVAVTLRSILSKEFTDEDINTIAVVLMSHSLVEAAIERVLYLVLNSEYPHYGEGLDPNEAKNKMEDGLCKVIEEMSFRGKLRLIEPCLNIWQPDLIQTVNDINTVRNRIDQLKTINDLRFKDKLIWSEEGLKEFFRTSQVVQWELGKLCEKIDGQHARCEKWVKDCRNWEKPFFDTGSTAIKDRNKYLVFLRR